MKKFNILKNKILLFSFVLVFFGIFFGVSNAKAVVQCCLILTNDKSSYPIQTTRDCRTTGAIQTCDTIEKQVSPCPVAKIMMPDCTSGSGGCVDVLTCPFSRAEQSTGCNVMQECKDAVARDVKDCTQLSSPEYCALVSDCEWKQESGECLKKLPPLPVSDGSAPSTGCTNPLGCNNNFSSLNKLGGLTGTSGVRELIGRLIKTVMGIIGTIALVMFVAGGLMWMTAAGNSERTAKALKMITWASLGIAVIFSAYVLVQFVFSAF